MATITTINGSDNISTSDTVINTNFANLNTDKIETSYLDTDTTLAANSDSKIPTQKAVKTYIDSSGGTNASESARGIVEEATDAEVTTESSTGGTGAKLFVTPNKLGIVSLTADEDLTAGQTVGISNHLPSGAVARAKRNSTTATTSYTMNSSLERQGQSFPIGADKFVFLNSDTAADTLYATVGSINTSTKTISIGTSVAVTTDEQTPLYVGCKLDTDKFIVFYKEDASTTIIKYRVGTVSGTTITFGSAATYFTGGTSVDSLACCQISTDKAIAFFGCATVTDSRLVACTVSSTTATAGTPLAIGTTIDNNIAYPMVAKVGTDKFILALDSAGTSSNYCQVGTLSGTTITLGTETVFSTNDNFGNNTYSIKIVSPTTDVVVIHHSNSSNVGEIVAGTISGTTPTFGTPVATQQFDNSIVAVSSTEILLSNTTNNYIYKFTRSGTTMTSNGLAIRTTPSIGQLFMTDNSYYIGVYASSTTLTVYIQGMTNMFHGIVTNTVSRNGSARVRVYGVSNTQTSLIPGCLYQPDGSGGLTAIGTNATINTPDDKFVTAISSTQVLL